VATFFLPKLRVWQVSSKHSHTEKKREQGSVGGKKQRGVFCGTPLCQRIKNGRQFSNETNTAGMTTKPIKANCRYSTSLLKVITQDL